MKLKKVVGGNMAESAGLDVVIDHYGVPLPPTDQIDLDKMHPIGFYPSLDVLEGSYLSRGLGALSVVVYGDIYTKGSDVPVVVMGDPIAELVKNAQSGEFNKSEVQGIFRGFAVSLDNKPRMGRGNEQPPPLSASDRPDCIMSFLTRWRLTFHHLLKHRHRIRPAHDTARMSLLRPRCR